MCQRTSRSDKIHERTRSTVVRRTENKSDGRDNAGTHGELTIINEVNEHRIAHLTFNKAVY